jgi:hypothetical protein
MSEPVLEIMPVDPRSPEATELIGELSEEIAQRYDYVADGSGNFKPEDALVEGPAFVIGYAEGRAVALNLGYQQLSGGTRPTSATA